MIAIHPSEIARNEQEGLRVEEWPDPAENPRILDYWRISEFGHPAKGDETHWCSALIGFCCRVANVKTGSANGLARSWLDVGTTIMEPEPGCLAIFWRGERESIFGHVGFVIDWECNSAGKPVFLDIRGGNQGDRVSVRNYSTDKLLGYRRLPPPRKANLAAAPLPLPTPA